MNKKRIGYACLIGPTNAGKSTLWETIEIFLLKIVFNKVDLPALVGPIKHA